MKKDRFKKKKGMTESMNEHDMPAEETIPQEQAETTETETVDASALDEQLAAATQKADEYLNLAQRVQADFDNFRRRNESVRADAYQDGQRTAVTAMLPVMDNLERALAASGDSDDALRTGVEMTLRQMRDILTKMDVSPIDRLGEVFDPNLENAVLQGTAEEGEPGTVCAVLQKGYRMGDHVLRHAMVKVVAD